ncbi:peptidoglycan-binding protein [Sphingobium sp. C100]|jgi:L,D-transpeptidase YcbB|uniref:L,D-transpeptidase family protein n=1 Tax=Sphingobium sp. C100 TaxID=1207055 RepID=UPI0003D5ED91|nr:L,D-transpeptidase family protein [Sphingobium sp. C100]ETI59029.1 peptidoglycan-binding protein [Sphingobium sp. C100]
MNRPHMIRFPLLALLGLGAVPLAAQTPPPAVAPTLPGSGMVQPIPALRPPVPIPPLSPAQEAWANDWLKTGAAQGLMARQKATGPRTGPALVNALLDRARALSTGRVDTADFLDIWALRPAAFDPRPGLAGAVAEDRLDQWAKNLTPPWAGYETLRMGLARYEAIRDQGGWPGLTAASTPGAVRTRIAMEDPSVTADEKLADVIQRAQRRYGLNPTGTLDTRTLAALNVSVDDRIAAIMANMERWRWMPRTLPVNRVQVNIAAAVLTLFEGDQPVTSMRAVTGSPTNQTPMLSSSIHSIVVNPPWNVPMSIAKRELFPKGRATLIKQGYKIVKTPEGGERIVQPAGPNSALGRLKFDFNNPFAVYLHDTPARGKFASYDRLASHGCIRLEKPVALAEQMVAGDPDLNGQIQTLIDEGKTQRVSLPQDVAVYLLYWTAFANNDAVVSFRSDPYGWDKLLAQKIEASSSRADPTAAPTNIASKD